MIEKRAFDSLGRFSNDWLNARHHFSFGGYHDPDRMGWGALRVWNDDEIAANGGFSPHPHESMEIITYVREGAISHRDSLGNAGRTVAGDVQVMSAGSGIRHSEFNQEDETTTLFQIWILPRQSGGEPRWDSAAFPAGERTGQLVVLASGDPETDGGLLIRQDATVRGATLLAGQSVTHALKPGHRAYLVLAIGSGSVNGVELDARDGAAIRDEAEITITASADLELVMVEVPE
ncbi:MAG: redox-sensitive bicupin YhaK (pirin superfamily) [Maricaulis sp.]|jgi:redox-sensitive bicupin YhaK (pirin superfamily)